MHSTPITTILNVTATNTSTPPFFKVKDTLKFSITHWVMSWARKVIEILSSVTKFLSLFSIRKDIRNSLSKCIHFQFFYFSFFMNQDHTKFYFTDLSKKKKKKKDRFWIKLSFWTFLLCIFYFMNCSFDFHSFSLPSFFVPPPLFKFIRVTSCFYISFICSI